MALKLDLYQYLDASRGLDEQVKAKKYSKTQLKLLSMARILCSKASIYILDSSFGGLTYNYRSRVDQELRRKEKEGVIVIVAVIKAEKFDSKDKIAII
jgi:ABC-type multidrug transport system ATPase subunit